jgi:hypothetical protein
MPGKKPTSTAWVGKSGLLWFGLDGFGTGADVASMVSEGNEAKAEVGRVEIPVGAAVGFPVEPEAGTEIVVDCPDGTDAVVSADVAKSRAQVLLLSQV